MDVTRLERMAAKYDGTDSETFYRRELEQTRARLAAMADEAREAMNVRTIKLANGGVVRMSYAVLCKRLGFRSDIHFVEITNSGTITFTCGKPREVSGLLWAVRDAGFIPAASLQRNGE